MMRYWISNIVYRLKSIMDSVPFWLFLFFGLFCILSINFDMYNYFGFNRIGIDENVQVSILHIGYISIIVFTALCVLKIIINIIMNGILDNIHYTYDEMAELRKRIIPSIEKDEVINEEITPLIEENKAVNEVETTKQEHKTESYVKNSDVLELMLNNMSEIRKYYSISKSHAQSSFILACITCFLGMGLLIGAFVMIYVTKEDNSAIIAVIGGTVTELFAGTAMLVHKSATKQLNHYYKALHENEQFLSTVNLVSKISEEKQDEMYVEIIRSTLSNVSNINEK